MRSTRRARPHQGAGRKTRARAGAQDHRVRRDLSRSLPAIDKEAQEELLLLFVPKSASPGDRVVRVGERGDAMYFVVSGTVEVNVNGTAPSPQGGILLRRNGAAHRRTARRRRDGRRLLQFPRALPARLPAVHVAPSGGTRSGAGYGRGAPRHEPRRRDSLRAR